MDHLEKKKCNYCKVVLPIYKFSLNRKDEYLKSCDECRVKQKAEREKSKCKHGRQPTRCKECGGNSICKHGKIQKSRCLECNGSSICKHGKIKNQCVQCDGASVCKHEKLRSSCKECKGSSVCDHGRIRAVCVQCDGASICIHKKRRIHCNICDLPGHLIYTVRSRIRNALKSNKELSSREYIGCDMDTFKIHIEKQFKKDMTWDNHGEWHIDHIIPVKYKQDGVDPSLEEITRRLHYTNTQPLWASDNISKGNRYIGWKYIS